MAAAFSQLYAASIIRSADIRGNSTFTTREIRGWLVTKENAVLSPSILATDKSLIKENYRQRGYLAADAIIETLFSEPDSAYADVAFTISEGKQTVVGDIALRGQTQFSRDEIIAKFNTQNGDPLIESVLESDIEDLLLQYERIGFPFALCDIEELKTREGQEADTVDIVLAVDEGEAVTIDEIRVEGNKETDPAVVVRETRIASGEMFNPIKVEAIRPRLMRLNIFSDVAEPELYQRNDKSGLLIRVQEGSTNTFDGVIGYIPGNGVDQAGYLTGLVSVSMRNLFGTGRKLSFRWAREDRLSQELGVRYLEPWIFSLPANVGGGFLQRQQDSSYVRRVFDVKAELMLSEELSVAALFSSENIIPAAADQEFTRVFQSSILSFGGEILYDTRDDGYSPTRGARYRTDYQYGRKRFSNVPASLVAQVGTRASVQRFTLDLDFYLSFITRQVFAFGIHGKELRSSRPEEGEMFRLGGSRTLRGFRESQFIGSRVGWSNLEYRFLLARRSFFFGFVDGGYYFRPADAVRSIPKSDAFKYGYGIGIQLETGLGILGVSFALGSDNTSFSNGTIHFGLINDF
ncbi:MAG: BamA/TamA family outer membrane protein [Ignavibacteriae bacterium]|nr:BamA/TamA family outer membrane protein [Ignavibacteriota bacterium]